MHSAERMLFPTTPIQRLKEGGRLMPRRPDTDVGPPFLDHETFDRVRREASQPLCLDMGMVYSQLERLSGPARVGLVVDPSSHLRLCKDGLARSVQVQSRKASPMADLLKHGSSSKTASIRPDLEGIIS